MLRKIIISSFCLTLVACQEAPKYPTIAHAESSFEAITFASNKTQAMQIAVDTAKIQCQDLTPIVLYENTIYHGLFSIQNNRLFQKGSIIIGNIFGDSLGDKQLKIKHDKDYEYRIIFQCK